MIKKQQAIRIIISLIILLALSAFLFFYYAETHRKAKGILVTGIIDGIEVNLSPKVAGRISWICCKEGDMVGEGQQAVRLESEDIAASVRQALAGAQSATADVKVAESTIENSKANLLSAEADVRSARADVERDMARMEELKREAERAKSLFQGGFISRESQDQAVMNYDTAAAEYRSSGAKVHAAEAKRDAAKAQLETSKSQLNSSAAKQKEARANVEFYQSKLSDTVILSPVTGTVIFRAREIGETVSPGVTILTLVDLNSLYARVDIDETKIGGVALNSPAKITFDGLPGKVFGGTVYEIGRYAEFATQRDVPRGRQDIKTFRVKVRFSDPEKLLKPGMTVDVEIPKKG